MLDNLIHGYFILGHPERLDYDYEHIYALVAYRAAKASGKLTMAGPATVGQSHPQASLMPPERCPATSKKDEGRRGSKTTSPEKSGTELAPALARTKDEGSLQQSKAARRATEHAGFRAATIRKAKKCPVFPRSRFSTQDDLLATMDPTPTNGSVLPAVESSTMKTLFLGGGAYCFQRHMQFAYPGTEVDVAEIDPNVTRANFMATGLPRDTTIKTYWGDARQFVDLHQDTKKYDLIFGDAFNDFSVPWHLTTLEFNEKLKKMLTPNGVYMINIIDAYESDAKANEKAEKEINNIGDQRTRPSRRRSARMRWPGPSLRRVPRRVGQDGEDDVQACVHFRDRLRSRARATRDFVVVASNEELDVKRPGQAARRPQVLQAQQAAIEPRPFDPADEKAIDRRSRDIVLTDDYAPSRTSWPRWPRPAAMIEARYESANAPESRGRPARVLLYAALGSWSFWFPI